MHADRNTAIALAAILTVWFFGSLIAAKGLFSQETAAWVQAIGAIAAIFVAAWLASIPIRQAEQARRASKRDFVNAIIDAAQIATQHFEAVLASIAARDPRAFSEGVRQIEIGDFSALKALLKEPISTWPSPQLYVRANNLLRCLRVFQRVTREMTSTIHHGTGWALGLSLAARYERDRRAFDQSVAGIKLE